MLNKFLSSETFTIRCIASQTKSTIPITPTTQRLMKPTPSTIPDMPQTSPQTPKDMHDRHTIIVSQQLAARDNKILRTHLLQVSSTEENLPRHTHR